MTNPRVSERSICPPWVKACVHFDGQMVLLCDIETARASALAHTPNAGLRWSAGIVRGGWITCICHGEPALYKDSVSGRGFNDYDEARTAFEAAERELLAVNYG